VGLAVSRGRHAKVPWDAGRQAGCGSVVTAVQPARSGDRHLLA
jgi:hypothetical protein